MQRVSRSTVVPLVLVLVYDRSGKLMTIYPANFKPADIEHDVPKLAASQGVR